ncbi:ComEA family DNA-binding protein [Microbacterium sp. SORGH_AS_0888]|uniref:ComEA family DNA-binding protein n=1 Tax=Microbacterium sp. SORGH_AS_0888 TaxID=3041791 RepID=UPI00358F8DC1
MRIGVGAALTLLVGGFALVVATGMLRGVVGAEPVPVVSPTTTASPGAADVREAAVYVHVAGAVRSPGLYVLSAGSRVVDAVGAAGGLADDADAAALNLARPLSDGEQIRVPRVGESAPAAGTGVQAPTDGVVDLNTADAAALDTLPRVGPAIAQRIIEWREANGAFTSVDDLLAIPGIGEKMLESLRDRVRV